MNLGAVISRPSIRERRLKISAGIPLRLWPEARLAAMDAFLEGTCSDKKLVLRDGMHGQAKEQVLFDLIDLGPGYCRLVAEQPMLSRSIVSWDDCRLLSVYVT